MDPQKTPSVRWFVGFTLFGAYSACVFAAIGAVVAGVSTVTESVWFGVGALGAATVFAASATFQFWIARVTKEGRPVGVQVVLTIQLLSAAYYVAQMVDDQAHFGNHLVALITAGLLCWWYLRVMTNLQKTPPTQPPTAPLQNEWVL
jgi:hypothetical protein